jgi:hypothetical protein
VLYYGSVPQETVLDQCIAAILTTGNDFSNMGVFIMMNEMVCYVTNLVMLNETVNKKCSKGPHSRGLISDKTP